MITTSGTTGVPKCIQICEESFMIYLHNLKIYDHSPDQVYFQFSRCTFDPHIKEILGVLCIGGSISMTRSLDPVSIHHAIETHKVNVIQLVPSFIQLLYETKNSFDWSSIQLITLVGEALLDHHIHLLQTICPNSRFLNTYGPAECTIESSYYKLDKEIPRKIPYWVSNYRSYLLHFR